MDLRPWNYWTRDMNPYPETNEVLQVLETVLAKNPNHPALHHVHLLNFQMGKAKKNGKSKPPQQVRKIQTPQPHSENPNHPVTSATTLPHQQALEDPLLKMTPHPAFHQSHLQQPQHGQLQMHNTFFRVQRMAHSLNTHSSVEFGGAPP